MEGVSGDCEANSPLEADSGHEEAGVGVCFEGLVAGEAVAVVEEAGAWWGQYQALGRTRVQRCKGLLGCNNTKRMEEFHRLFAARESSVGHTHNTSWVTGGVD